mgnify:CR=1 FL=1
MPYVPHYYWSSRDSRGVLYGHILIQSYFLKREKEKIKMSEHIFKRPNWPTRPNQRLHFKMLSRLRGQTKINVTK